MTIKETDIPIRTERHPAIKQRKLEDCEPAATIEEVLQFIEKVATSPKPCVKRAQSPDPVSK